VTRTEWIEAGYLFAALCFILSLKLLNSPATARRGNWLAMAGMAVALVVTFLNETIRHYEWIVVGVLLGSIVGFVAARRVAMTAMPQMVALFNGVGGGAVALVSLCEYRNAVNTEIPLPLVGLITSVLSAIIGSLSFSGSLIAFGKLQEVITTRPLTYKGQRESNLLLLFSLLILAGVLWTGFSSVGLFCVMIGLALLTGILFVLPIGGADMPVVISLLNSFTGLAAGLAGFVLGNTALLIGGALVGASGLILTFLMCSAMNRSLENVLFGAFGTEGGTMTSVLASGKSIKSYTVDDVAIMFANAENVVIVPGYGMAVAQAQHVVKELAVKLQERGVDVKFAIHPVAGRMPGHMNVLLAEADVPYDLLYDLEEINPLFPQTDVVLVVGANDVVNPAARYDKNSPIYGMPILDVDRARSVVVIKRSMARGFAGVDNELFTMDKTSMVFGDAKAVITKLIAAINEY